MLNACKYFLSWLMSFSIIQCNGDMDYCKNSGQVMDECHSSQTSQALVLYDENLLSPFQKDHRTFTFAQTTLEIKQDWASLGVAAVVWDAAIVLCEYLEGGEINVEGKSVIELGAGSGLVGIVAALLGADVTITEREVALEYLNKVVKHNLGEAKVKVRELDWTKDLSDYSTTYDIILGADIIYIEDLFPDLLKTLKHLSNSETVILISCHIRYDRDQRFLNMMKDVFIMNEVFFDKDRNIHIYKAKKKGIKVVKL